MLQKLRNSGYSVKVQHKRPWFNGCEVKMATRHEILSNDGCFESVSQNGGETTVEITTPEGRTYVGVATCSAKDAFNRKLGLKIAIGRALEWIG